MLTYSLILLIFVVPIIIVQGILIIRRRLEIRALYGEYRYSIGLIAVLTVIALLYTTPWDNYLVKNQVWWYDDTKVLGVVFGYVPIEEYGFFILETIMVAEFTLLLSLQIPLSGRKDRTFQFSLLSEKLNHKFIVGAVFLTWAIFTILLILNIESMRYLSLILSWSLIPVLIQLAYSTKLIVNNLKFMLFAVNIPAIYLSMVDILAIHDGIWTISSTQTIGIQLFGILPIEEMIFFYMTSLLVVFGYSLALIALKSLEERS
ncbi:MAG: lycopene cyclase domain-containing protein [Candidatus Heimdallarchaeota archaeon]|nr:lycopene cyclase domain-containing protein [Candidatus Heimdallarchaeota archaeon]